MNNPEDPVIDAINTLVDEQLARGPVDDYEEDYYPDCNRCPHQWHGEHCLRCDCDQSTGEHPKNRERHHISRRRHGCGYSIADLEALRDQYWHHRNPYLGGSSR